MHGRNAANNQDTQKHDDERKDDKDAKQKHQYGPKKENVVPRAALTKMFRQDCHEPIENKKEVVPHAIKSSAIDTSLVKPPRRRARGASFGHVSEIEYIASDSDEAPATPSTTAPSSFSEEPSPAMCDYTGRRDNKCEANLSDTSSRDNAGDLQCRECEDTSCFDAQSQEVAVDRTLRQVQVDSADEGGDEFAHLEKRAEIADLRRIRRCSTAPCAGINLELTLPMIARSTLWKRRDTRRRHTVANSSPINLGAAPPGVVQSVDDTPNRVS